MLSSRRPLSSALLTALLIVAIANSAEARDRQHTGGFAITRGGSSTSGTYNTQASGNLRQGLTRNQCITNRRGKNYTRSTTTTYDRNTGAYTHSVVAPDGTMRTYNGTIEDGQGSGTYTTSNGKSGSWNGVRTRNGDGTVTRNGSVTNQNGQTYNTTGTYGYDRSTNTLTGTGTGALGNNWSGSLTVNPDPRHR